MVITFGFNMFMFGYDFSGGVFDEIFFGESSGCFIGNLFPYLLYHFLLYRLVKQTFEII